MRTCAAALEASQASGNPWDLALLGKDAARLLRIAADALDTPEPLGEPMELLRKRAEDQTNVPPQFTTAVGKPIWGGDLPPAVPRPCPSCGSIDARTVKRNGRKLMLTCPACEHEWEYR
jgi:hypothetical protein